MPISALSNAVTGLVRHLKLLRKRPTDSPPTALQLDLFGADVFAPDPPARPVTPAGSPRLPAQPDAGSLLPEPTAEQALLPAPAPGTPGQRQIMLGQHRLAYELRRSKRRTIGFMIDDDGLRITAPKWVGVREIESAIREKQRWILAKLHEHRERVTRRLQPQMQWRDGGRLPYLGGELTLVLVADAGDALMLDADAGTLTVSLPAGAGEQQLKDRVQAWLQRQAKALFAQRLPLYADKLAVRYQSFALSSATTQWGSCTADGRIRLNWRLVHFALPLIDYVIAHELAHLREMNHGPRFWATVQSVFPEFDSARKALRTHAPESLPAF